MRSLNGEFDSLLAAIHQLKEGYDQTTYDLENRLAYLESNLSDTQRKYEVAHKHLKNMLEELGENNAE